MTATEQMESEIAGLSMTMSISQQPQSTTKQDCKSSKKRLEVSWERDLNKYVADTNRSQQSLESIRLQLAARVLESPTIAETWWEFLHHEETTNPESSPTKPGQRTPPGIITLFDLYDWAARLVPQKGNKTKASFVNIWLGHARQQWLRGKDDALDAIKALKTQQIGLQYAPMYAEWAGLEAASGNNSKAMSIVNKGLKEGAMPRHILDDMLTALKNDTYVYAPFWTILDADKLKEMPLGDSNAMLSMHLSTTAPPPQVPQVMSSIMSQKDDHTNNTALQTPTMHSTRHHQNITQQHQHHTTTKQHTMTASSSHINHHHHTQQQQHHTNHSTMHPTTLTRTYHSHGSSSGIGSDDATATMPTIGGNSGRSGGSASGTSADEEATVNIRNNTGCSTMHTATLGAGRSAMKPLAEETIVINNNGNNTGGVAVNKSALTLRTTSMTTPAALTIPACSTPKEGPPSSSSNLLSKSRSFGGLGRAMRVTPTATSSMSAATTQQQQQQVQHQVQHQVQQQQQQHVVVDDAADRKRKALVDAVQSPKPSSSTGDAKRRSPCDGDAAHHRNAPDLAPIMESPRIVAGQQTAPAVAAPRQVVLEDASGKQHAHVDEETAPILHHTRQQQQHPQQQQTKSHQDGGGGGGGGGGDPDATVPLSRPVQSMPPPAAVAVPSHATLPTIQQQQQQPSSSSLRPPSSSSSSRSNTRRVIEDENVVIVRDITYTKLECVGRGGSSKVYKVMAPNKKIFALKRIRLNGRDAEAATGFLDEIVLLTKLNGRSNIIQLIDSEVHKAEGLIYMVLEYGDIDLAKLLQRQEQARKERMTASNGAAQSIDENFIRLYWEQMLHAVDTIHRERIVHSDLKPANFLVVEGQLKLIDFGIAKAIQNDTTSIARESQVGTLNYMSPEAILGGHSAPPHGGPPMKVGRASDIWSLGCILYQMVYGRTPFAHLPFIQKMQAIIDTRHQIDFPSIPNAALVDVIRRCLDRNPRSRITMAELLEHPFLRPPVNNSMSKGGAAAASSLSVSGSVELSKEQLRKLLLKVTQAGVSDADVSNLSEQLFTQLSHGDLSSPELLRRRASLMPPPPSRPTMENNAQSKVTESSVVHSGAPRQPLMPLRQVADGGSGGASVSIVKTPAEMNAGGQQSSNSMAS